MTLQLIYYPVFRSIIVIAVIAALVIAYYQSASTKAVAAQCDIVLYYCRETF